MGLRICTVQSCPIVCKLNSSSEKPTWILETEWSGREMKEHVCKIQIRKQIPAVFLISPSYFSGKNM